MQLHVSWYVYGPRAETGASALAALFREIGVAQPPVVVSAPARAVNVRRNAADGILDDGLTAEITTNLPRLSAGTAGGTQVFFPPGFSEALATGTAPTGAALTAALDALKPSILAISTVTSVQVIVDLARPLTDAQVRAWRARANAVLGNYLNVRGCRLQANGVSARLLAASPGMGGGAGALLLMALGFGYYLTRERT